MPLSSFRSRILTALAPLTRLTRLPPLAALAAALLASAAAHAGTYSSLAAFQQNVRADVLLDNLNGPDDFSLASLSVAGNGYGYTIDCFPDFDLARVAALGVGAKNNTYATRLTVTGGKPVSAFAATLRVANVALASIGGPVTVVTDTGESFNVTVAAGGGTFFGFTSSRPFSTVTVDTGGGNYEFIDDVYVGTAAAAPTAGDQCSDAETVALGAFPFTTVGAARDLNTSSCSLETTSPDVYFRFVPPATGTVTADTCGCNFDSILRVFDSCGGTEIACNDDACSIPNGPAVASRVSFRATAGQAVIIRIAGYLAASGSGTLTIAEHNDCPGDFNHSGGANVQDIFDFLAAWFQGCP